MVAIREGMHGVDVGERGVCSRRRRLTSTMISLGLTK